MASRTGHFAPVARLRGSAQVPGDKSISHRALLFAALAEGPSRLHGVSDGDDVAATARCLRQLGVRAAKLPGGRWQVDGGGLRQWHPPSRPLDCGNSGTTMRLLAGALAAANGVRAELVGDASLMRRPMNRVVDPLRVLGGELHCATDGRPPLRVAGQMLHGGAIAATVASAQVKSALLLAGLHAQNGAHLLDVQPSRDHSERLLVRMGARLRQDGNSLAIEPGRLQPLGEFSVPGDPSSAAFLVALALLHRDAALEVAGVGLNPTRSGFVQVLARMGGAVQTADIADQSGEPVGTLRAASSNLRGCDVDAAQAAACIDELPVLMLCAAAADGPSHFAGLAELRVKESDRLAAMARLLGGLGVRCDTGADWATVHGVGSAQRWAQPPRMAANGDHRIGFCAALCGLAGRHPVQVGGWATTRSSWPEFAACAAALAANAA